MQIINEPVRQQKEFTSCAVAIAAQSKLRDDIERQTAEFLARGGRIYSAAIIERPADEIPSTYGGYADLEKKWEKAVAGKINSGQHASGGHQNLSLAPSGRIQVLVNKVYLGSFATKAEAIGARDKYREANGMTKAVY